MLKEIKKIDLTSPGLLVLVFHPDTDINTMEHIYKLIQKKFKEIRVKNIAIVATYNNEDPYQFLNSIDMEKLGWVRKT